MYNASRSAHSWCLVIGYGKQNLSITNQVELSAGATPKLAAADEGTKPLHAVLLTSTQSNYCLRFT